ncbi:MAG TPA: hypothetical protein VM577_07305 [Anaerovoracaceae bacterium]|nr:hypothetical protein [Anaerovoracaceae bacterium]
MTVFRSRGEIVAQTETVQLRTVFRDFNGIPTDLPAFPKVTIIQPSGNVVLGPTSAGVYRLMTGVYGFDYAIGINASIGVWTDFWTGDFDGYTLTSETNFVVQNTQLPAINSDGYIHLGDDPGFNYSQVAIQNINKLLKTLKARLNSSGKAKSIDAFGNDIFIDCDIYSVDVLVTFIANSLTLFNEIPHFTFFTFDDTDIIDQFHDVLVQGSALMALSSKALIERGREFQISDNGVQFTPPTVSELLTTQWQAELTNHTEKVKMIKFNMKPAPMGLGTLTISTSRSPAIARLRHLRERQLF